MSSRSAFHLTASDMVFLALRLAVTVLSMIVDMIFLTLRLAVIVLIVWLLYLAAQHVRR